MWKARLAPGAGLATRRPVQRPAGRQEACRGAVLGALWPGPFGRQKTRPEAGLGARSFLAAEELSRGHIEAVLGARTPAQRPSWTAGGPTGVFADRSSENAVFARQLILRRRQQGASGGRIGRWAHLHVGTSAGERFGRWARRQVGMSTGGRVSTAGRDAPEYQVAKPLN